MNLKLILILFFWNFERFMLPNFTNPNQMYHFQQQKQQQQAPAESHLTQPLQPLPPPPQPPPQPRPLNDPSYDYLHHYQNYDSTPSLAYQFDCESSSMPPYTAHPQVPYYSYMTPTTAWPTSYERPNRHSLMSERFMGLSRR